jgi:ComF family protein
VAVSGDPTHVTAFSRLLALAGRVADFCYPGECANCATAVDGAAQLCDACARKLAEMESAGACVACGMPLERWGAPCPYCVGKGLRPYGRVLRLGVYADPLKAMIHRMKYEHHWGLAETLADRLWAMPRVRALVEEHDRIMAVPLHWWRQVQRGYNQSEVIAARLARHSGVRLVRPARRVRYTETQTQLTSQQSRELNLRGAFKVARPREVQGRGLLVVDDVKTSGATLRALGRELRTAGAARLSAIVLAVADPRGRGFEAV